jgi:hypothetical protein
MSELPKIVSVDDHVIEPAHLFEMWLPEKYKDKGPKHVRTGIGELKWIGGDYILSDDPDGPLADWWFFEDVKYPYKRNIAAAGFARDDMKLEGITYDEMRPGCYDPKARPRSLS